MELAAIAQYLSFHNELLLLNETHLEVELAAPVRQLRASVRIFSEDIEELVDGVAHVHWRNVTRVVGCRPDAAQLHEVEDSTVSTEHLERFNNKKHPRSPASWPGARLRRLRSRTRGARRPTIPSSAGCRKPICSICAKFVSPCGS